MLKKAKGYIGVLHNDQKGSYFVEMALVLIGVALAVFTAANGLATQGIAPRFNEIQSRLGEVTVPDLKP